MDLRYTLLRREIYDKLQCLFHLRTNHFHAEVGGYELLSAYDAII